MKKATLARSFIGTAAIFAAMGLVGCSAESAGPGEEIGESHAALSSGSAFADLKDAVAANGSAITDPVGRLGVASCVIDDGGTKKLLIGGGQTASTPTYTNAAYILDPSANSNAGEWREAGNIGTARAFLKAITDPSDIHSCLFVGGIGAGGMVKDVDKATISAGAVTWTHIAAANELRAARARFALATCGTGGSLIAIGGGDGSSYLSSIEMWNGTGWTTASGALTVARQDFAFATNNDGSVSKFTALGGRSAGNLHSAQVDALVATVNGQSGKCTQVAVTDLANPGGMHASYSLNEGRDLAVAFPSATADQFVVVAGDMTSALASKLETLTVNWAGSPAPYVSASTNAAYPSGVTALRNPVLVPIAATDFVLVGGESHAGSPVASSIMKYTIIGGTWSTVTSLAVDRVEHVAEYLDNGAGARFVFAATGRNSAGTYLTSSEQITP